MYSEDKLEIPDEVNLSELEVIEEEGDYGKEFIGRILRLIYRRLRK